MTCLFIELRFTHFLRLLCIVVPALVRVGSAYAQSSPIPPQWIDPSALRADLTKMSNIGKRRHPEPRLQQARKRLSEKWLPALQGAEAAGDPIATLILRDCESATALDRKDIDATCSTDSEARERAYERLRALDVGASSEQKRKFVSSPFDFSRYVANKCTGNDKDRCVAVEAIQILEARLKAVENDARLATISEWNINICPDLRRTPSVQDLGERCETLRQHLLAVKTLARRYFLLSLTDHPDESTRIQAYPYARFGDVRRSTGDSAADVIFHNAFYGGVYRSLLTMDANIKVRMVKDPRWHVFLRETPKGLERPPMLSKKAAKRAIRQAPTVEIRDFVIMRRYAGTYEGGMISSGTSHVITKLFPSGNGGLEGRYLLVYGREIGAKVELGSLGPCMAPADQELLCIWRDRFGIGNVSMVFNADASEFKGLWGTLSATAGFRRMQRKFWNETTLWDGKLQ